jgi:hypothetical protein
MTPQIPASEDSWIPWAGGECPVAPGTHVAVKLVHQSSGAVWDREDHEEAGHFDSLGWWTGWRWKPPGKVLTNHRIVAYRILNTQDQSR